MDLQRHKWKTAGTYDVIIRLVCWVDLAQQLSHHTATQLPCPTPEDKGDNRKRKSKKTGGLLERQFNKWRKDKKNPAASSSWRISKEALNVNTVEIMRWTKIILIKLVGNSYFHSDINSSDSTDCLSPRTLLLPQGFFLTLPPLHRFQKHLSWVARQCVLKSHHKPTLH